MTFQHSNFGKLYCSVFCILVINRRRLLFLRFNNREKIVECLQLFLTLSPSSSYSTFCAEEIVDGCQTIGSKSYQSDQNFVLVPGAINLILVSFTYIKEFTWLTIRNPVSRLLRITFTLHLLICVVVFLFYS